MRTRTIDDLLDQSAVFETFDRHPSLVRAPAVTRAGNVVRSARRERRLRALNAVLGEVTCNLPDDERRRVEAIFGYLSTSLPG